MREVCVIGVGMTPFGKFPQRSILDLGREACLEALRDAQVPAQRIEAAYCGHARTGRLLNRECGIGQSVLWELGISGIPISSVGNFCASGSTAFRDAWLSVASGLYDIVMALGAEQLTARGVKGKPLTSDGVELLTVMGFSPPTYFAQIAQRHMHDFGTTREQLALVAVKNRKNACGNPRAQYRKAVTVEEVLKAPMIVDPLTLLSCCPTGDGAAAAILCSREMAARYTARPITVAAAVLKSGEYQRRREITTLDGTVRASREAYERAGLGPEELDVAEVHDCFTPAEILHYEDLGLCPKGEGGAFIASGATQIGGTIPVNPSGGLISKGHPLGATGIAQIAELVWQLRGQAGDRQVEGARVGLAHCAGGFQESLELAEVASVTVIILKA
ncbi:MAG: thiolase family protein [Nitrospinae bacterium]|nr:thiolase family protein [Nitrospinota bacterium]